MSNKILEIIIGFDRRTKTIVQIFVDTIIVIISILLATKVLSEHLIPLNEAHFFVTVGIVVPATVMVGLWLGLYKIMVSHMSILTLKKMLACSFFSAAIFLTSSQLLKTGIPPTVPFVYMLMMLISMASARLLLLEISTIGGDERTKRVAIYGAGDAGRQLLNGLDRNRKYTPVFFIDDNPSLQGISIGEIKVHSISYAISQLDKLNIDMVLIAIPSASQSDLQQIFSQLNSLPVQVRALPGLAELINGKVNTEQLRRLSIEDLLSRPPVHSIDALMDENLRQKTVLVTGAGGSIGSELCREIITHSPAKLIVFDVSEYALYKIMNDLESLNTALSETITIIPVLGTIQNERHVNQVLKTHKVQTVYHTAAYKHVPLVESNIIEGLRNNVFGTLNIVQVAAKAKVENFILVSTDKAVRPTNYMGASKRIAELICQAFMKRAKNSKFAIVRFGNVLGSSGSVVPLFEEQIKRGGPLSVTHKDVERYFMTPTEAAHLVIQAGFLSGSGDVFVLDMGTPIKILDLAQRMIRLNGFTPVFEGEDCTHADSLEIKITGLRPGEKLFEELVIEGKLMETLHPQIHVVNEPSMSLEELEIHLQSLQKACDEMDFNAIKIALHSLPIAFDQTSENTAELAAPRDAYSG
jgi:FlaA1/EpsC-like NDP-sugar epimerase